MVCSKAGAGNTPQFSDTSSATNSPQHSVHDATSTHGEAQSGAMETASRFPEYGKLKRRWTQAFSNIRRVVGAFQNPQPTDQNVHGNTPSSPAQSAQLQRLPGNEQHVATSTITQHSGSSSDVQRAQHIALSTHQQRPRFPNSSVEGQRTQAIATSTYPPRPQIPSSSADVQTGEHTIPSANRPRPQFPGSFADVQRTHHTAQSTHLLRSQIPGSSAYVQMANQTIPFTCWPRSLLSPAHLQRAQPISGQYSAYPNALPYPSSPPVFPTFQHPSALSTVQRCVGTHSIPPRHSTAASRKKWESFNESYAAIDRSIAAVYDLFITLGAENPGTIRQQSTFCLSSTLKDVLACIKDMLKCDTPYMWCEFGQRQHNMHEIELPLRFVLKMLPHFEINPTQWPIALFTDDQIQNVVEMLKLMKAVFPSLMNK